MEYQYTNPCSRCGKERIISRTWIEKHATFSGDIIEISCSENICPDPQCQKILDSELAVQKEKRMVIARNKEQRAKDNQAKKGGLHIKKITKDAIA